MALSMGCVRLRSPDQPRARKVLFFFGQLMHLFFIFCVVLGVFSRHFDNGGVQLVAYTLLNLYVYALCLLNWPVKVYFKEYDLDLESSGTNPRQPLDSDFDEIKEKASSDKKKGNGGIEL
jgi:hypothetical protein